MGICAETVPALSDDGVMLCDAAVLSGPNHAMSNASDAAELYRRLNAVEQAISNHTAECNVRNENLKEWMGHRVERERETHADLQALKLERAKVAGICLAVGTVASALGSGGVLALFKLLGH